MAETIATVGKEVNGRYARVTASVSNFVPKAHTPYQWNGMQTRDYFKWAHQYLWKQRKIRSVNIKCHDVETSLLEGVISRGDRRIGDAMDLSVPAVKSLLHRARRALEAILAPVLEEETRRP